MPNRARNRHGLGKQFAFTVPTPMRPWTTWIVTLLLRFFDWYKPSQDTAKALSFLPFVHWVVVKRDRFPRVSEAQPVERLKNDYLFFLSTFNGVWGPYIDAFSDVLVDALDGVWLWSLGYPSARQVTRLKAYIEHNQIENEHSYCAYPGASVRDVRAAMHLSVTLEEFAKRSAPLDDEGFVQEFDRLLLAVQHDLGSIGTFPPPERECA